MAGQEKPKREDATVTGDDASEAELIQHLRRSVDELTLLNELAQDIGGSRDSRAIIQRVVDKALRAVAAEQAVINLVDLRSKDDPRTFVRAVASRAGREHFHLDQNLLGCLYMDPQPMRTADPQQEERLHGLKVSDSVASLLCVPLTIKDRVIGILAAYNKFGASRFSAADERLLEIIAGQSAQVIENARLYEQEKTLQAVQTQLRMAKQIQLKLLPARSPTIEGYELAGTGRPAHEIGGDYYDFIPCGDGRWAICLADVAGKGMPAALLMANLHAALRGQLGPDVAAATCVAGINHHLFRSTERSQFVSLFLGLLDPDSHCLSFCNAGHDRPILMPAAGAGTGEAQRLPSCGPVLGLVEERAYREESIELAPDDLLVLFSDGITEAINRREEEFGVERLITEIVGMRRKPTAEILGGIFSAVEQHAGTSRHPDDMTLSLIRRQN